MTTAPRATELQCQTAIVHHARSCGWMVHAERPATRQSGAWSTPIQGDRGWPDLVLCHPERRLFGIVELKRKPNTVDPDQQRWLDALAACGIHAAVWWVPEELDAIYHWLTHKKGPTE